MLEAPPPNSESCSRFAPDRDNSQAFSSRLTSRYLSVLAKTAITEVPADPYSCRASTATT